MIMHEECLEGDYQSILKLKQVKAMPVPRARQVNGISDYFAVWWIGDVIDCVQMLYCVDEYWGASCEGISWAMVMVLTCASFIVED